MSKPKEIYKCPDEGKKYDQDPQVFKAAESMINNIKSNIKISKDMILLDFGTGTGNVGIGLSNDVKTVIFEEVSDEMLNYLKEKIKSKNINNYIIFNDFMDNYKGEKLDLITVGMVLHHIEDIISLFNLFYKNLKENSYLCLTDFYENSPLFNIKTGEKKHHHKLPHKGFNPEKLCENLKECGFKETKIIKEIPMIVHDEENKEIVCDRYMIIAKK